MTIHGLAASLELMAARLKQCPDGEIPKLNPNLSVTLGLWGEKDKEPLVKFLRSLGSFKKRYNEWSAIFSVAAGDIELEFWTPREIVCHKVKVVKEVEEWDCESILAGGSEESNAYMD